MIIDLLFCRLVTRQLNKEFKEFMTTRLEGIMIEQMAVRVSLVLIHTLNT